jgi:hypothetical protein
MAVAFDIPNRWLTCYFRAFRTAFYRLVEAFGVGHRGLKASPGA